MKVIRIQGVQLDLDAIKAANLTKESLAEFFKHLPKAEKAAAYEALSKELDAHKPAPVSITIEIDGKEKIVKIEPAEAVRNRVSSK